MEPPFDPSSADAVPTVRPATFLPVKPTPAWKPWLLGLGGGFALLMAGLLFLLRILTPAEGASSFPVFLGGFLACFFLALGAFTQLFGLLWSPRRLELDATGIHLTSPLRDRHLPWDSIGWLETTQVGGGVYGAPRQAVLFVDPKGRKLATATDALAGFEVLVERSRARLGEQARQAGLAAELRKLRRSSRLSWTFALVLAAIVVYLGFSTWSEHRAEVALAQDGVEAEAQLDRHTMHFVTPRVEATLDVEGRSYPVRTALTQEAWDALEGAETVTVRYLPQDPANHRVVEGEVDLDMLSSAMIPWLLLAGLLGAVGLAWIGWLQGQGKDLRIDPETRRFQIVEVAGPDLAAPDLTDPDLNP